MLLEMASDVISGEGLFLITDIRDVMNWSAIAIIFIDTVYSVQSYCANCQVIHAFQIKIHHKASTLNSSRVTRNHTRSVLDYCVEI